MLQRPLCAQSAHRRPQALGASRRPARSFSITMLRAPPTTAMSARSRQPASSIRQRQLFEEMVFVLDGRGSTTVWNDAGARVTFEWKAGSIFGIPLNCWHQHFNGSGQAPARYVSVTNAPVGDQSLRGHRFRVRPSARLQGPLQRRAGLFRGRQGARRLDAAPPISSPDAVNLPLPLAEVRGAGGGHVRFNLAKCSLTAISRSSRSRPTRRPMRTRRAPM